MLKTSGDFRDCRRHETLTVIDRIATSRELLPQTVNDSTRPFEVLRTAHYLGNVAMIMATELEQKITLNGSHGHWNLAKGPDLAILTFSSPLIDMEDRKVKSGIGIMARFTDGLIGLFSQTDEVIREENHITEIVTLRLPTQQQLDLLEIRTKDREVLEQFHHSVITHDRQEAVRTEGRTPLYLPEGQSVVDAQEPAPPEYLYYFTSARILIDRAHRFVVNPWANSL